MQATTTTKPVVREGMRTPWGDADFVQIVADGIGWVSTPGHGGVKLSRAMNARMPDYMRKAGGWYEEDCEWALVYVALAGPLRAALPDDTERIRLAERSYDCLRNWHPDAFERFFVQTIPEGESTVKDERIFKVRHANDFVCISAATSKDHEGFVEVTATRGAVRDFTKTKTFLVPSAEYDARKPGFGFVVNPAAHKEI